MTTQQDINITQEINQILKKAQSLRGFTLDQLTEYLSINTPKSLIHAKGLTGQIIEVLLGANAKSLPIPDFPELNLEIKTIPITSNNIPLETTYICTAPLLPKVNLGSKASNNIDHTNYFDFKQSVVYKKLAHVLWVPIISPDKNKTINRTIGSAFLWQPSSLEFKQLQTDWLELTQMMFMGELEKVSSHFGEVLQIRPKAADSSITTTGISSSGDKISTLPRGFYLRKCFTQSILKNHIITAILP